MPETEKRKGGHNLSTSVNRKAHYTFYKANTYARNKLGRILQSSGVKAAQAWARTHLGENVLARLMRGRE